MVECLEKVQPPNINHKPNLGQSTQGFGWFPPAHIDSGRDPLHTTLRPHSCPPPHPTMERIDFLSTQRCLAPLFSCRRPCVGYRCVRSDTQLNLGPWKAGNSGVQQPTLVAREEKTCKNQLISC